MIISGGYCFIIFLLHGYTVSTKIMDQSYQFYFFILSATTLFADVKPMEDIAHNWFDAQDFCVGNGLTIEREKSGQPYWTGVYRRLTPWIKILGCYPEFLDLHVLPTVIRKSMKTRSVGMCQEMCYQEKQIHLFAVKKKSCICIRSVEHFPFSDVLEPLNCNVKCVDYPIGDCGGENTYNLFEFTLVAFESVGNCLSLQCSTGDTRFIPQQCSQSFEKVCENKKLPDESHASNWTLSVEHCKRSTQSFYLYGNVDLNDPHPANQCSLFHHQTDVFWLGVARQTYISIDQGWEIQIDEQSSFLKCQVCTMNNCSFKGCSESLFGAIFCKNKTYTSQSQNTTTLSSLHQNVSATIVMPNHSTTNHPLVSESKTGNYDKDQSTSTIYTQQTSSASDKLALKISLPVITVFIILLLCAMAVVFYSRRKKMTKADGTTKVQSESGPRQHIGSNVDCVQNNSYFVLEQCPQYISKGSYSSNESPYNNSEEGVYDHLRDKKSRKPEVEDTYQHASASVNRDMSEYDTMANAVYKKQEENDSYDYSHQDTNGNYACHIHAKNNLTDNPYDVAV